MSTLLDLRVVAIRLEAEGIISIEFEHRDRGKYLPAYAPGAHIDLHLPAGVRSYSLVGAPNDTERYLIAVSAAAAGRGGSAYLHERLRVGDILSASEPKNFFPLESDSRAALFIAGGIGITPIYSMIQFLQLRKIPWELHYFARSATQAAFHKPLAALGNDGNIYVPHFELAAAEAAGALQHILENHREHRQRENSHTYCCGPSPMLQNFESTCVSLGISRYHLERFSPEKKADSTSFRMVLAKRGIELSVEPHESALECLSRNGISHPCGCMAGSCGACEATVLSGQPDHMDSVLSDEERIEGKSMMLCCSRSLSEVLVLDI